MPPLLSEADHGKKLVLGTVQFGIAYGIAGLDAPVCESEVQRILDHAVEADVQTLDTAAAYGDIEQRLLRLIGSRPLKVVSKIPSLPPTAEPKEAAALSLEHAERSLTRLDHALATLMFHRSEDLLGDRGDAIMECLLPWAGRFGIQIGVSGYKPKDVSACRTRHGEIIRVAQLPGNALDQRVNSAKAQIELEGVEVHLRSAFLQGLLLMDAETACDRLPGAAKVVSEWHLFCNRIGIKPLHAALGVVKSFTSISAVVLGVDTLEQWQQITSAWQDCESIEASSLACQDDSPVIDPRLWNTLK